MKTKDKESRGFTRWCFLSKCIELRDLAARLNTDCYTNKNKSATISTLEIECI